MREMLGVTSGIVVRVRFVEWTAAAAPRGVRGVRPDKEVGEPHRQCLCTLTLEERMGKLCGYFSCHSGPSTKYWIEPIVCSG